MNGVASYRAPIESSEFRLPEFDGNASGWWSLRDVLPALTRPGPRRVVAAWLAAVVLSVAAGIAVVQFDLSAISVPLGFTTVSITLYPPILLGMLLLLWLGPGWAIGATYLATFALGAFAGLSPVENLLFSLADPVQLLIVWAGLMVLDVPFDIRTRGNWAFFLALTFTGSVGSSLGALVWNYSQDLSFGQGFRIWEGWVIGAFLQGGLLVVPIHHFVGRRARAWLERNLELPCRQNLSPRGGAVILFSSLLLVAAIGLQVWQELAVSLSSAERPAAAFAERLPEVKLFLLLMVSAFVGATALFTVALTKRSERERALARVDGLTGCLNRRAFKEVYDREAHRSLRLELPLASIFLDLDHFKAVNDDYGYALGDLVLQETAARVTATIRDTDYLVRWGGEEFIVLLPHTSEPDAALLAQRIRSAIRDRPMCRGAQEVSVTASQGVVGVERPSTSPTDLVNRAAEACRVAKCNGRDRIESATRPTAPTRGTAA